MLKKSLYTLFLLLLLITGHSYGQESLLKGRILNAINNEPLPFATVVLKDGKEVFPVNADSNGVFLITVPRPGLFNLEVIMTGFKSYYQFEM